jgi:hypothetical protein
MALPVVLPPAVTSHDTLPLALEQLVPALRVHAAFDQSVPDLNLVLDTLLN